MSEKQVLRMGCEGIQKYSTPASITINSELSRASQVPYRSIFFFAYFQYFPYYSLGAVQLQLQLQHPPLQLQWSSFTGPLTPNQPRLGVSATGRIPSWVYPWDREFTEIPTMGTKRGSKYGKVQGKVKNYCTVIPLQVK